MNTEPATRDFSAFAHDREVKCLVKGNNVIAAERCIDEQKLGCWCEAGYGALRALEVLSTAPARGKGEHQDEALERQQSKRRIDLVQLKARAAGFAKAGQDFAGAALSHMNRELQRKRTVTPAEERYRTTIREHREAEIVRELRQSVLSKPARLDTEVSRPDTKVSEQVRAPEPTPRAPAIIPKSARNDGDVLAALVKLGYGHKIAKRAALVACHAKPEATTADLVNEALRVIRDPESDWSAADAVSVAPKTEAPILHCKWEDGCTIRIRSDNTSGLCGPHRRVGRKRTPPPLECPKCHRRRYQLAASGVCRTCEYAATQATREVPMRETPASIEVAKEEPAPASTTIDGTAVAEWLKRGLQIRRALEAKVERLSRELLDTKQTLQQLPKE